MVQRDDAALDVPAALLRHRRANGRFRATIQNSFCVCVEDAKRQAERIHVLHQRVPPPRTTVLPRLRQQPEELLDGCLRGRRELLGPKLVLTRRFDHLVDQLRPRRALDEAGVVGGVSVVSGADEQVAVLGLGGGDDLVHCGVEGLLLRFVEDAQLRRVAGVDRVLGDDPAGHGVDGADEGGLDLLGGGDVAVVQQPLLGLLHKICGGTDGERRRDDLAGLQRCRTVAVYSLRQSGGELLGEAVGLPGACGGGDDGESHE